MPNEIFCPAAISVQLLSVPIWVGVCLFVTVPSPSCFFFFYPHAHRVPSDLIAKVWLSPISTLIQHCEKDIWEIKNKQKKIFFILGSIYFYYLVIFLSNRLYAWQKSEIAIQFYMYMCYKVAFSNILKYLQI